MAVRAELVFEHPDAVPADEGAEQVDGVCGWNLVRQCVSERRLAAGVDEEVGCGQWDEGRDRGPVQCRRCCDRLDRAQLFRWVFDGVGAALVCRRSLTKKSNDLVCDVSLPRDPIVLISLREASQRPGHGALNVPG